MEIVEIIGFHLNYLEEVLEVSFRTNSDNEDMMRESEIPFMDISDFGYNFHEESSDSFLNEEDDNFYEDFEDDNLFVDENEILSFLNEYYVLFSDKLPKAELF